MFPPRFARPAETPIDRTAATSLTGTRRSFFDRIATGLTGAALLSLLESDTTPDARRLAAAETANPTAPGRTFDLKPRVTPFEPRAKAVIQLFMQGGPSQVDLFDPKPMLDKYHGQEISKELFAGVDNKKVAGGFLRCPWKFASHGQAGIPVSELLPHLARCVDDMAVIRSMYSTHSNHEPALYMIQSGRTAPGLPSLGSWIVYGLGSVNQNLPAYVVLNDPLANLPTNREQNWQAGYLPPIYQGTRLRPTGAAVLNLQPEVEAPPEVSRLKHDLLTQLDRIHLEERPGQLQLDARIASYELAARMQLEAPAALDLAQETQATLEMYGIGEPKTDNYGRRCLIARRLIERGVRFVQLYTAHQIWDAHNRIETELVASCEQTDKPVAALLQDLKQRGLLESTLVLWGGEFGRLPIAQLPHSRDVRDAGRDHGPFGFTTWMAGGGVRGGVIHGATDDIGFAAVENKVSVTDWHATILHLLGLSHESLFYERNGLKEKLTSTNQPRVVTEILA